MIEAAVCLMAGFVMGAVVRHVAAQLRLTDIWFSLRELECDWVKRKGSTYGLAAIELRRLRSRMGGALDEDKLPDKPRGSS